MLRLNARGVKMRNDFTRAYDTVKCYDRDHDGVSDTPSLPQVATITIGEYKRKASPKQQLRCQICEDFGTFGKYSEMVLCEHHRDVYIRECV